MADPEPPIAPEPDFDWSWTADDDTDWVPPAVDMSRPSVARIYDYGLGGKDNFAVDREAAHQVQQVMPDAFDLALANRAFLGVVVRRMARAGIRQFLDLGTGIPTSPNVHEIAREVDPSCRVAYVDNDPIVLAHSRAKLEGIDGVVAVSRDLRDPVGVLEDRGVRRVIDPDQPVGLLFISVLHFVDLGIGAQVVRHYLDKAAPGSLVAFSVGTVDDVPREITQRLEEIYRATGTALAFRTLAQTEELFDGLVIEEPGIQDVTTWASVPTLLTMRMHAGIGRKP